MYKFLLFINKITFVLLFVVIEVFAFRYYFDNSSYNRAKLINLSNNLAGGVYVAIADVHQYLHLKDENLRLISEVAMLRDSLERHRTPDTTAVRSVMTIDSVKYDYTYARVVNNTISRSENFITLDRGLRDGITRDMAIISDGAIVGYVLDCSDKFSVAMSVLNTKFRTSGKIKGTENSGIIHWEAGDNQQVRITGIPKASTIKIGDTIVTTEYSSRFPPDLMVGTIKSFEIVNGNNYDALVTLAAKFDNLSNVVLVKYNDFEEKTKLEGSVSGGADK